MKSIFFTIVLISAAVSSACKISRLGMSTSVITAVTESAVQSASSNSKLLGIYASDKSNDVTVEMLDEKDICTTQLFDAYFDTLNCKPSVTPAFSLIAIPCKLQ